MEKILTAFATDGGDFLNDRHFGDADSFLVYEISPSEASFVENVGNPTSSGGGGGGTKKALEVALPYRPSFWLTYFLFAGWGG